MMRLLYLLSEDFAYTMFLYLASSEFAGPMNALKQMTAVSIIYLAIPYVVERKFFKFAIAVGIAVLFHQTALIWLVMYFFVTGEPWSKKMTLFLVGIISFVAFFGTFTNVLDSALEDTAYSGVTQAFEADDGVNPIRVLISSVPAIIAFVRRKEIEPYLNPAISMCINLSVVVAGISFIGIFTSGILIGRFPVYFSICNWALLPWMFNNSFKENDGKQVKLACTVGYIAYFLYNLFFSSLSHYGSERLNLYYGIDVIVEYSKM